VLLKSFTYDFVQLGGVMLDISSLESWLWDAACAIRGAVDAPKFKDYILPLIFLKRLSDVFEDELQQLGKTAKFVDADHSLVRFYIPVQSRWDAVSKQTTNLGEFLTDAVRWVSRENPKLSGVIDIKDFNETAAGQRLLGDNQLRSLIQVLSQHRLGLKDVAPDMLGNAYEYLLRKFAEGQGQSAGEFYTPPEVAVLMSHMLDPQPGNTIYDPACGSGGLLIKCNQHFKEVQGTGTGIAPLRFFGQELNAATYAMCRMNAFIHDMDADVRIGDTMHAPSFLDAAGSLQCFDRVTANPMWNQKFDQPTYEHDTYGRFDYGIPPTSSADWGWLQHMYASLSDKGKMGVVLDTGAVSRGSGNQGSNRERDIRKRFVEEDLVEAVILMPENLFYNTSAPGIILVINKDKKHKKQVMLINASKEFSKGRPKNFLTDENISRISEVYHKWQEAEGLSKIVATDEALRNDSNLSPSRYVAGNDKEEVLPLEEAVVLLNEAEEERQVVDKELKQILAKLGLGGLVNG
jgi:type I restriction enzyme M protein